MNKVKTIMVRHDVEEFDKEVNKFAETHKVFATQYKPMVHTDGNASAVIYTAMIFYKEE